MNQYPESKPIEEQLVWIYWGASKQMAYYKDNHFRDIHTGIMKYKFRKYKWTYLN